MKLARRVMWKEGMFLRAHHFQQQDLRTETLVAARAAALEPFHWGFARLEIDAGALSAGQVGLGACAGAFPDGALFDAPGEAAEIAPLAIPSDAADQTVWLTTPALALGAPLGADSRPGVADPARYAIRPEDLRDALDHGREPQPLELGRLNLRLALGPRPEGFEAMPVARVTEVANGRVRLDPEFIPPLLDIAASPALARGLRDIAARLEVRADQIAGPLGTAGGLSTGAIQQLLLLQLCNGKGARLAHMAAIAHGHPERLFAELVETAAELSAFTDRETRRPPPLPAYDHDDLTTCFRIVIDCILRSLGALEDPEARQIPLEFHPQRKIHFNRAIDGTLLEGSRLFLLATSGLQESQLREALPGNVSIGATGEIFEIMSAASRSVTVTPRAQFPPEIRQLSGWVCFELDQNAPSFRAVREQRTLAIHAQAVLEPLELQLWAVKD